MIIRRLARTVNHHLKFCQIVQSGIYAKNRPAGSRFSGHKPCLYDVRAEGGQGQLGEFEKLHAEGDAHHGDAQDHA